MKLLEFLNEHENWEELITAPPYCCSVKHEDEYVLIKYDMMLSNFQYQLCREARGAIFRKMDSAEWICVSHGLDKFFNYNETESDLAAIDWNNCTVTQKVDGTNIRIYMDHGKWKVSTLGCVDAYKAEWMNGISFGELVDKACGGLDNLTRHLIPLYCYYFELTGPNRIVINYGDTPTLWYLGRRNQLTQKEDFEKPSFEDIKINFPETYDIHSLTAAINAVEAMSDNEEGYVITSVDKEGEAHRVKMKGAEYLRLHKLRCNGPLTVAKVIKMWKDGSLDDFVSVFPDYNDFIDKVFNGMAKLAQELENNYKAIFKPNVARKDLAREAYTYITPTPAYFFAKLDGKTTTGFDFLSKVSINNLQSYLARFVKENVNIATVEDE